VIGGLHQPEPGDTALCHALERRQHQPAADGLVLHCRIDRQRIDGGNRPAFVEKEAADDGSVYLGDQSE
jgi:hypothetical protein